jgi:hypothetical protein
MQKLLALNSMHYLNHSCLAICLFFASRGQIRRTCFIFEAESIRCTILFPGHSSINSEAFITSV